MNGVERGERRRRHLTAFFPLMQRQFPSRVYTLIYIFFALLPYQPARKKCSFLLFLSGCLSASAANFFIQFFRAIFVNNLYPTTCIVFELKGAASVAGVSTTTKQFAVCYVLGIHIMRSCLYICKDFMRIYFLPDYADFFFFSYRYNCTLSQVSCVCRI